MTEFKTYLLLALRNFAKNKMFSAINVGGFAISMACAVMMALYVSHELSYDRHWVKADRIVKIMTTFEPTPNYAGLDLAMSASIIAPLFEQDFEQVETTTRIVASRSMVLGHPDSDVVYNETGVYFADSTLPEVFDIPLVAGSWEQALAGPAQIVINENLAQKYFGDSDPIGRTLVMGGRAPVRITAVMRNLEDNTHLEADAFMSMATAEAFMGPDYTRSWIRQDFHTYAVLQEGVSIDYLRNQIPAFLQRHAGDDPNDNTNLELMHVTDIHLQSHREYELSENNTVANVATSAALAVFVLIIASFNFMNLATARSTTRACEVGMRKTLGARRMQIIRQFLGESLLIALIAIVVAIGLLEIFLPAFSALLNLDFEFDYFSDPELLAGLLMLAVVVGLLAGSYPAFVLSSYSPLAMFKGEVTRGKAGALLRQLLVVLQFSISIALIIATLVVIWQLRYVNNADLGIDTEQVVIFQGSTATGMGTEWEAFRQEVERHPDIASVTAADLVPGEILVNSSGLQVEGATSSYVIPALNVDYDYFRTFDIEFLAGRAFARDRNDLYIEPSAEAPSTTASFVINATAARRLGLTPETAVGVTIVEDRVQTEFPARVSGQIIGVVEDVHFSSMREELQPMYFRLTEPAGRLTPVANFRKMAIKIAAADPDAALTHVESLWRQFMPSVPLQYAFLDQQLALQYDTQQREGTVFVWFSLIAISIAAIGLYGLAAFITEQKKREIGIRKTLGSTALGIVTLLSRDFGKLVLIANVIAWPVAFYFTRDWLQQFAYRVDLSLWFFLASGAFALLLAITTVSSLAMKAAKQNPVQALRYE